MPASITPCISFAVYRTVRQQVAHAEAQDYDAVAMWTVGDMRSFAPSASVEAVIEGFGNTRTPKTSRSLSTSTAGSRVSIHQRSKYRNSTSPPCEYTEGSARTSPDGPSGVISWMNCRRASSVTRREDHAPIPGLRLSSPAGAKKTQIIGHQSMNGEPETYEQRVIVYADIIGWKAACWGPIKLSEAS